MFWLLKADNYTNFGNTPTEAFNNMQEDIGSEYPIENCEFYKVESSPIKMKQQILPVTCHIAPDTESFLFSPYKER